MKAFNSLYHKILLERIIFQTLLLTSFLNRILTFTKLEHVVSPTHEAHKPRIFALDLGFLVHVVNARAGEVSRVSVSVLGITTNFRNLRESQNES